jgi:hypothetical protein
MQIPKPRELQVVKEDDDFIIINDGINNRIALRKPLRDGRWMERRDINGRLLALSVKIPGVN